MTENNNTFEEDQELLQQLIKLAENDRVSIRAAFISDPDAEENENDEPFLTHQVLILKVGDITAVSEPVRITTPFRPVMQDEVEVPKGTTVQ
jgi:hypothetical protein